MNEIAKLKGYCDGIGCESRMYEPMSAHTSFKIGGSADLLIRAADAAQAAAVICKTKEWKIPLTLIGKGSNLLVSDDGIRGAVLLLDENKAKIDTEGKACIRCGAGASLAKLCAFALEHSLSGLEFAWGIPGSVGGAVFMNAGAYGGEMKDVVKSVRYLDAQGKEQELAAEALSFSYRHSWFTEHEGCLVTEAVFQLQKGNADDIRAKMDDYMSRRREKQPLEYPSAGSTFKRPEGAYASALIDQCGLKGKRVGGAMVSEKHAGFLINYDHATCQDVLQLVEYVKKEVKKQTGYTLECEIRQL